MYILKNAFVSITRNKGRNILIGIIITVISCVCAITLAIKNTANTLIESYQEKYDIEATIGVNRENMRNEMKPGEMSESERNEKRDEMIDNFNSISNISETEIEMYGNSKYVKSYYYNMSVGLNSSDIEKVSMEKSTDGSSDSNLKNGMRGPMGKENFSNISNADFTLVGYSSLDAMNDFISGKYSITDGKIFEEIDSKSCVINSELATSNEIEVGDKITFIDPDDEDITIKLTITGIYEEKSVDNEMMGMFTSSANTIITNTYVIKDLKEKNDDIKITTTPTFILTSKDVIESFTKEVEEKGLSEYLTINTNLNEVEESTSTISNVKTFANTFLIMTLIIGGIVLFVINMINIRERKYEIGVLRTIGMKKSLLSLQFISELLMVSFISLILGACVGATLSVPVSNQLLENEITSSNEERNNIENNFGGPGFGGFDKISGVVDVAEVKEINAAVDFKVLIELLGIGLLLTLISSSASLISIQKFSPLRILKERT